MNRNSEAITVMPGHPAPHFEVVHNQIEHPAEEVVPAVGVPTTIASSLLLFFVDTKLEACGTARVEDGGTVEIALRVYSRDTIG
jgi:hypothetical protein